MKRAQPGCAIIASASVLTSILTNVLASISAHSRNSLGSIGSEGGSSPASEKADMLALIRSASISTNLVMSDQVSFNRSKSTSTTSGGRGSSSSRGRRITMKRAK